MEKTVLKTELENKKNDLSGAIFAAIVTAGAANLRANAEMINSLNVFPVPDGDTGSNMSMTMENGAAALAGGEELGLQAAAEAVAQAMLMGARGNSGVILSQFFYGVSKGLEGVDKADAKQLVKAMQEGVRRAYGAVMKPAEGTILTVARESVEFAAANINEKSDALSVFRDMTDEAARSLERTPELLPILKDAGVVDSGGMGLLKIMEGMTAALEGKNIVFDSQPLSQRQTQAKTIGFNADSEMVYGYCTELLLQLQNSKTDVASFDMKKLNAFLESVGNSIVSFMNGSIVKIHVHTMTPEKVLEFCRRYGEFLAVKIENMSVQHTETEEKKEAKPAPEKEFGVVAVCSGEGVKETFEDIGADVVIDGGQTNNPSAGDFIEAFGKISAEHIFVFPNNSNIILAAKQAAEMYKDADVRVIESKSVGAGYVAISSLDMSSGDANEIEAEINDSMADVETANISVAVRDAALNGVNIKKGDIMGLIGKLVAVSTPDIRKAIASVIDKLFSNLKHFMLTVFCGADAEDSVTEFLKKYFKEKVANGELYLINGGQSVYPYILVAE